ncbi:Serine carboxypeptidase, histidine active site [Sesbania bispinosa]|nr:Serine carboxypeptidase, histidine active site [Sesbania bispinosa]
MGTIPSKHYAGYVTVDESHGRNLYYIVVVSEGKPSEDPVVLWLNGDLGALALMASYMSMVSNVIYLDSPAGVGFSYSENETDYKTGDIKTASDTMLFFLRVICWSLCAYSCYEVMKGLHGWKCVTDEQIDGNALVPFVHGMGLISDDLYQEVNTVCNGNFYNPLNENCASKLAKVDKIIAEVNIYNILEPCYHGTEAEKNAESYIRLPSSFRKLGETERPLPVRKRMFGRAWPLRAPVRDGIVPTWPELMNSADVPCTDDEVANSWLNNQAVRNAIHTANKSVVNSWELCTDRIIFNHDAGSMISYHKNLTSKGYRALIFSGDHDMCVPFTGSQAWTRSVGYKIVDEWRPWFSNGQVAGFTQGYDKNLTFLTIKGSGHTVPEYKPQEALDFYKRFLAGLPL